MNATRMLADGLPADMAKFAERFSVHLQEALGDKLYSLYLYGAALFPHPPNWRMDFDYHVIVTESLAASVIEEVEKRYAQMESTEPFGKELDGYIIRLADARKRECPRDAVWPRAVDTAWALHRAHIHAGRFKLLYGENPTTFELVPEWSELETGLQNEFSFILEHPQYPQFGILNACRILYSREQHDVVVSKYASAAWALRRLNEKWYPAIRAAVRNYEERPEPDDELALTQALPDFLAFCAAEIGTVPVEDSKP